MTALVLSSLFFVFLLLSAIFSASETALFSLSKARLLSWEKDGMASRRAASRLMRSYNRTLITLVMGNMFVNSGLSISANEFFSRMHISPAASMASSVFSAVVLLLLFGEVTPKTIALAHAEGFSQRIAYLVTALRKILHPLILLLERAFSLVLDMLGRGISSPLSPEEYSTYLDMGLSIGAFSGSETEMLHNILLMRKSSVSSIMRPRVDIKCVKKSMSARKISTFIAKRKEHYYPVVSADVDDAVSFLSAKDFFLLPRDHRGKWLREAIFTAVFIPENASLTRTLAEMNSKRVPAALVVDEFGGVTGYVTAKSIYCSLIGEIRSEHESQDWQIRQVSDGKWLISGMVSLKGVQEVTGVEFNGVLANTLNGLFQELNEDIPKVGDIFSFGNCSIHIIEVDANRIFKAELMLLESQGRCEEFAGKPGDAK
ncbi:MAG: HlyC/CorC family transporter [Victivallales bacterium]|nr:HlyC/CorC family transporter [Victivallales bacterium]